MHDSPVHARLKSAAIDAVEAAGGIEASGLVTLRGKSTVGRWHTANVADLPTVDSALLLDRVSVARGAQPRITRAMAHELGYSLVKSAVGSAAPASLLAAQVAIVREGGDVQVAIAEALADNRIDSGERRRIRNEIADLMEALHVLDSILQAGAE